jgi:hypothetical protein
MVIINSIVTKWVELIGGVGVIYNILALVFVFTILYIFYKIST